jgi:hypothetical protein
MNLLPFTSLYGLNAYFPCLNPPFPQQVLKYQGALEFRQKPTNWLSAFCHDGILPFRVSAHPAQGTGILSRRVLWSIARRVSAERCAIFMPWHHR